MTTHTVWTCTRTGDDAFSYGNVYGRNRIRYGGQHYLVRMEPLIDCDWLKYLSGRLISILLRANLLDSLLSLLELLIHWDFF